MDENTRIGKMTKILDKLSNDLNNYTKPNAVFQINLPIGPLEIRKEKGRSYYPDGSDKDLFISGSKGVYTVSLDDKGNFKSATKNKTIKFENRFPGELSDSTEAERTEHIISSSNSSTAEDVKNATDALDRLKQSIQLDIDNVNSYIGFLSNLSSIQGSYGITADNKLVQLPRLDLAEFAYDSTMIIFPLPIESLKSSIYRLTDEDETLIRSSGRSYYSLTDPVIGRELTSKEIAIFNNPPSEILHDLESTSGSIDELLNELENPPSIRSFTETAKFLLAQHYLKETQLAEAKAKKVQLLQKFGINFDNERKVRGDSYFEGLGAELKQHKASIEKLKSQTTGWVGFLSSIFKRQQHRESTAKLAKLTEKSKIFQSELDIYQLITDADKIDLKHLYISNSDSKAFLDALDRKAGVNIPTNDTNKPSFEQELKGLLKKYDRHRRRA